MSKRCIPPLEKDALSLRLLERTDLEMTLSWRNENRRWFLNSDLLSIDKHRSWFEQYQAQDDDYVFIIERLSERIEPVGQISLYKIDWQGQKAEFGRLLVGESARQKGIAKKATEILLEYAFDTLGIKTIHLEVLQNNIPAISLYEQCGFLRTAERDNRIIMTQLSGGR
jgi:RimJ/RimL family protein N-acetyltransferase